EMGVSIQGITENMIAAFVPLGHVVDVANLAGVRDLDLEQGGTTNAGKVTSEGASVLRTGIVNAFGVDGRGTTVGVLSDSFNTSGNPDTSLADVHSGDLPATT